MNDKSFGVVSLIPSDEESENKARNHVQSAAQILKSLGPDRARIGWMLEDTLMYLDELRIQSGGVSSGESSLLQLEKIAKLANSG